MPRLHPDLARRRGDAVRSITRTAAIIGLALTAWLAVAAIATVFLALIGATP